MTLIQLKYFQTICKYNNITRASAELHVSQPSLSNAVKELEREFGVSLFTRRSRGLELTPEGRYFLDEADKLLEQAEQLTTNMKHMSTTDRTLTLGLPAMSGSLVFTDLLRTLYARSPGTHIQVMENGSLANRSKIMDHTLDAAIITRNGPLPPGIGHVTLRHVNVCLYLSVMHPLAEKDTVTTDDLDQLPLAMLPEDTFLDHCIDQYYETLHLKPSIIVRHQSAGNYPAIGGNQHNRGFSSGSCTGRKQRYRETDGTGPFACGDRPDLEIQPPSLTASEESDHSRPEHLTNRTVQSKKSAA